MSDGDGVQLADQRQEADPEEELQRQSRDGEEEGRESKEQEACRRGGR